MRYILVLITALLALGTIESQGALAGDVKPLVLVTGATGTQGGAVARELLRRGYLVRGLTRNPRSDRALALADLGAEMVKGDFDDTGSLVDAMKGTTGVFAVTDFWEHGFEGEVRHGRNLIDAAGKSGNPFFVYSSVASADRNTAIPHFDSKWEIENHLRASGLDFAIIRPVSFMENWSLADAEEGEILTAGSPEKLHQHIAATDIGRFAANALDSPETWNRVAIDIAGDEISLNEICNLLSAISGNKVVPKVVSWEEYENLYGEEMTVMYKWFDAQGYDADIAALRARHPDLVRIEDYLRSLATGGE